MNVFTLCSLSRNSSLSTNSSNCSFTFSANISLNGNNRMSLQYLLLPSTIYNIDSTNNKINFIVSPTTYTITIPSGLYDASTLASTIQTLMTAQVANAWSVTYSSITKLMTFTGTSAFQLLFSTGANASTSPWYALGFSSSNGQSAIDTSSATTTTSTNIVQLGGPLQIYFKIGNLASMGLSSDLDYYTFVIPNTGQSGSYIEYNSDDYFAQWIDVPKSITALYRIDVVISDRLGKTINLNGGDWIAVFRFENN